MTIAERVRTVRTPWHLWLVAAGVFAIYLGGARDFYLVLNYDTDYIASQFGAGGVAYFTDYPLELRAVWTVNVAAGLLGPLLLLARSRRAAPVAVIAVLAQVALAVLTYGYRDRWDALSTKTSLWDLGVLVVTALFAWYCLHQRRRGVLR